MTTRRFYANGAPQQLLSAQINSSATTLTVPSFAGWPTQFPFFATLELGTTAMEVVSVTGITGGTATIVRAQDGSAAISHLAGATFDFTYVRQDFDEANLHTSSNSGVHGISGSVVGATDVQTLTNKTLASPTITGTSSGTNATLSGTLGVTGTATLGVVNASGAVTASAAGTGLAVTNNATVGGTLGVTGAATAASFTANGNGLVAGVVAPKSYANQAAAPAATAGQLVYLTAPTGGFTAGVFIGDGTQWVPAAPQRIVTSTFNTNLASTTTTEVVGYSQAVSLINGKRYRVKVKGLLNGGVANDIGSVRVRYDTAAVTNVSTLAGASQLLLPVVGSNGRCHVYFECDIVAPSTATYNIAIGVVTAIGTGSTTLVGTVDLTLVQVDYIGL